MVRTTDWIQLANGKPGWPLEPLPEDDIDIENIATGLAFQCRYNGQVKRFYSVAEHCYHVSYVVDAEYALWGLLHDAEEGLGLPDLSSPVKRAFPEYKKAGVKLLQAVATRFNLGWPEPPQVKEMDTRILFNEREVVLNPSLIPWGLKAEPIPGVQLYCWGPEVARIMFLARFQELWETNSGEATQFTTSTAKAALMPDAQAWRDRETVFQSERKVLDERMGK